MYYDVIIKSKSSFLDTKFTYESESEISIGTRVIVPFGKANSLTLAFVLGENKDFDKSIKVKKIVEIMDVQPILTPEMIMLAKFMVKNNLSSYSQAIQTLLPPGSIDNVVEYYDRGNKSDLLDAKLYDFLSKTRTFKDINENFKTITRTQLKEMVDKDILEFSYKKDSKASKKYIYIIELAKEIEQISLHPNAKKQRKILEYLDSKGKTEQKKLLNETNTSLNSLKNLIDNNFVKINRKIVYRNVLSADLDRDVKPVLNTEQENVINEVLHSNENSFLIHGITGSGKTEIYLRLVEYFIKLGKEAIILVPEISLTPQTINRFQRRFGQDIAVLHSKLSISERYDQWSLIKKKKVKIVVGARSAIFAPFENLGLIVVDEEHESSYKSEKNPKYDAREIAKIRAKYNGAKLILGTATPSIDTMYKTQKGQYKLLKLENRATKSTLPNIDVVDMREELKSNNFSMFSKLMKDKIDTALANNEQVILFLNKRGHTSYVFCRSCGYVHRCEACDVAMTYHKYNDRLVCHFCGRTSLRKPTCEACGSTFIKEFGAGTEKLEEEAIALYPNKNIFRMDADTVSNKNDYNKVYDLMINKKIDILIGTQMLAKGLDFPNVTLVGVIVADISLNLPDFKASEKTYQLLTQVAGRAGRGQKKGSVVIQTYKPEHFAIESCKNNDYYGYYNKEINNRKKFSYPPFINILTINFSSKIRGLAIKKAQEIIRAVSKFNRENSIKITELSGPTPNVIERVNNYYRFNVIVKAVKKEEILQIANYIKENINKENGVYINYTINPDSVY